VCVCICIYTRYDTIDWASNYEISYFISTPPTPSRVLEPPPSIVVISAHTHTLPSPSLTLSLFSATDVHPLDPLPRPPPSPTPPRSFYEVRQNLTLVTIVNSAVHMYIHTSIPRSVVVSPSPLHNL